MIFRKWGGGGSKAIWNFSKNSSLLETPPFPYGALASTFPSSSFVSISLTLKLTVKFEPHNEENSWFLDFLYFVKFEPHKEENSWDYCHHHNHSDSCELWTSWRGDTGNRHHHQVVTTSWWQCLFSQTSLAQINHQTLLFKFNMFQHLALVTTSKVVKVASYFNRRMYVTIKLYFCPL